MSRFSVVHETRYGYTGEVHLTYNRAHLLPRPTLRQRVDATALLIGPEPDLRWDETDADGNLVTTFSLERPHDHLTVTATSEVSLHVDPVPLAAAAPWEDAVAQIRQVRSRERVFTLDTPLVARLRRVGRLRPTVLSAGAPPCRTPWRNSPGASSPGSSTCPGRPR